MTSLTESRKRDFIKQLLLLIANQSAALTAAGLDPTTRTTLLQGKYDTATAAEAQQKEAQAQAKTATETSQLALKEAYTEASSMVALLTGTLGKDHPLVEEIRKMRN
ncbi:hypothetical protein [Mangrovibacterium lignilyticum]|uniref:hypothetical protein n=1 Tax=Mangrovibacterium lignilyticum TaxID=2668052 RepID=UPI0013D60D08|nr:hypothetical protein [Mangrovibacterium lignilyticum]